MRLDLRAALGRGLWAAALLLALAACQAEPQTGTGAANPAEARPQPAGDAARGWAALQAYGCQTCHAIPGLPGAAAYVGPPLTAWADRQYIAGNLVNTPDNLVRWILDPQAIEPGTAMPNAGVTEEDARDMTAYLYTLTRADP
jgi:cytochrome c1